MLGFIPFDSSGLLWQKPVHGGFFPLFVLLTDSTTANLDLCDRQRQATLPLIGSSQPLPRIIYSGFDSVFLQDPASVNCSQDLFGRHTTHCLLAAAVAAACTPPAPLPRLCPQPQKSSSPLSPQRIVHASSPPHRTPSPSCHDRRLLDPRIVLIDHLHCASISVLTQSPLPGRYPAPLTALLVFPTITFKPRIFGCPSQWPNSFARRFSERRLK